MCQCGQTRTSSSALVLMMTQLFSSRDLLAFPSIGPVLPLKLERNELINSTHARKFNLFSQTFPHPCYLTFCLLLPSSSNDPHEVACISLPWLLLAAPAQRSTSNCGGNLDSSFTLCTSPDVLCGSRPIPFSSLPPHHSLWSL